jgi:hypothetical protein
MDPFQVLAYMSQLTCKCDMEELIEIGFYQLDNSHYVQADAVCLFEEHNTRDEFPEII